MKNSVTPEIFEYCFDYIKRCGRTRKKVVIGDWGYTLLIWEVYGIDILYRASERQSQAHPYRIIHIISLKHKIAPIIDGVWKEMVGYRYENSYGYGTIFYAEIFPLETENLNQFYDRIKDEQFLQVLKT